jgi:flagellar motility protein MotE (MotC chaperone)
LKIKEGLPALNEAMRVLHVSTRAEFETWLEKEKQYLQSMNKEPLEETQEMEYHQKLVNLHDSEWVLLLDLTECC